MPKNQSCIIGTREDNQKIVEALILRGFVLIKTDSEKKKYHRENDKKRHQVSWLIWTSDSEVVKEKKSLTW